MLILKSLVSLPQQSRLFLLHSTAYLYKLYIIVVLRLHFHSHTKNKQNNLGSNNDFLPYSHRLQYILMNTGYCTITIINHKISQSLCEAGLLIYRDAHLVHETEFLIFLRIIVNKILNIYQIHTWDSLFMLLSVLNFKVIE